MKTPETIINVFKSPNIAIGRLEYGNEVSEHVEQIKDIIDRYIWFGGSFQLDCY